MPLESWREGDTEGVLIFFFPPTPALLSCQQHRFMIRNKDSVFLIKEQCINITNYSFDFSKAPHPNPLLSLQGKWLAPWVSASSHKDFCPGPLASFTSCKCQVALSPLLWWLGLPPTPWTSYPPT